MNQLAENVLKSYDMKKIISIGFCLLLFCSCVDKKTYDDCPVLRVSLEQQEVSMKDLFGRLEVIPLETNDSCLLVSPTQVLCENGRYEVFDFDHSALFLFDKNGQFLKKVGQRGNGP